MRRKKKRKLRNANEKLEEINKIMRLNSVNSRTLKNCVKITYSLYVFLKMLWFSSLKKAGL